MKEISTYIADGAMAFLKAEYKILTYFVIIAALLLGIMGFSSANSHWSIALAFIAGAILERTCRFYRNEVLLQKPMYVQRRLPVQVLQKHLKFHLPVVVLWVLVLQVLQYWD